MGNEMSETGLGIGGVGDDTDLWIRLRSIRQRVQERQWRSVEWKLRCKYQCSSISGLHMGGGVGKQRVKGID